jgi:uncharacterized membrane protein YfcA
LSAWQVAAFLACVVAASCTQSITGFALSLVLLGLTGLFQLAPLPDAANVATALSLATGIIALRSGRRAVDWPALRATAVGTVVGVPLGVLLLGWLHANVVVLLRVLLGVVVIACAIIVLVRTAPLARRSAPASFSAFGLASGLLGGLFSASGPPLVWQFYRQPMSIDTVRDTLLAVFAAGSALRLVMVVASGQFTQRSAGLCVVAVPLAMGVTWWMRRHPPPWPRQAVLKIVCALLMVTGVGLVAPALHALF